MTNGFVAEAGLRIDVRRGRYPLGVDGCRGRYVVGRLRVGEWARVTFRREEIVWVGGRKSLRFQVVLGQGNVNQDAKGPHNHVEDGLSWSFSGRDLTRLSSFSAVGDWAPGLDPGNWRETGDRRGVILSLFCPLDSRENKAKVLTFLFISGGSMFTFSD